MLHKGNVSPERIAEQLELPLENVEKILLDYEARRIALQDSADVALKVVRRGLGKMFKTLKKDGLEAKDLAQITKTAESALRTIDSVLNPNKTLVLRLEDKRHTLEDEFNRKPELATQMEKHLDMYQLASASASEDGSVCATKPASNLSNNT